MSNTHSNPPAFPTPSVVAPDGTTHDNGKEGMTLRDYFAAKALAALITGEGANDFRFNDGTGDNERMYRFAQTAYMMADWMLKARTM